MHLSVHAEGLSAPEGDQGFRGQLCLGRRSVWQLRPVQLRRRQGRHPRLDPRCRQRVGKDGINVNIVCPLAWTAALENFQDAYPEAFKANVHMPPAGHYGDVEKEIGRVVVQLCGPDFKYMNGETVTLEGGMGQRP